MANKIGLDVFARESIPFEVLGMQFSPFCHSHGILGFLLRFFTLISNNMFLPRIRYNLSVSGNGVFCLWRILPCLDLQLDLILEDLL